MNPEQDHQAFTELRSLLSERADLVPPCDLEEGFLNDLHKKIHSENLHKSSLSLLRERVSMYFEQAVNWPLALTSAAAASVVCAFTLGYFIKGQDETQLPQTVKKEPQYIGKPVLIKAPSKVESIKAIPVFSSEPVEF